MKKPILIIVAASFVFVGCHKGPVGPSGLPGTVHVTFRPLCDGVEFDKTNIYLSAANERVLIQQVKFYLSPIELVADSAVEVSEAELLDLTEGPQERWLTVPSNTYDSLHFGLGVPYALNHRDITTVEPPDPPSELVPPSPSHPARARAPARGKIPRR